MINNLKNLNIEKIVIYALLINNNLLYKLPFILRWDYFFDPLHSYVYRNLEILINSGINVNLSNVKDLIFNNFNDESKEKSFINYLLDLSFKLNFNINVTYLSKLISDLYQKRLIFSIGKSITVDILKLNNTEDYIHSIESCLNAIKKHSVKEFVIFEKPLLSTINKITAAFKKDNSMLGLSTGIKTLDKGIGGLHRSDLIILAGRPGMGKTSLAINIAYNISSVFGHINYLKNINIKTGGIVGFFSLEMSSEQLALRIISDKTNISSYEIRNGNISELDLKKIVKCSQKIKDIPLYIDETGGIRIDNLITRSYNLKKKYGLDLIIVDYIQLMNSSKCKFGNRVQELTEITAGLKTLSKDLNIPVLALSQLSRQVESRENKEPKLSDLRESGSIEQDADIVLFIYRDNYYNIESNKDTKIIIAKQRNGPTGSFKLKFEANTTRFKDIQNKK